MIKPASMTTPKRCVGGKSNSEIAAILGLKTATVGKHLERIYPKLGVENRTAEAGFDSST